MYKDQHIHLAKNRWQISTEIHAHHILLVNSKLKRGSTAHLLELLNTKNDNGNCWGVRNNMNLFPLLVECTHGHFGRVWQFFPNETSLTLGSNNHTSITCTAALKNYIQTKTSLKLCMAALFIMAKNLKKLGCPSIDGIHKQVGIHPCEGEQNMPSLNSWWGSFAVGTSAGPPVVPFSTWAPLIRLQQNRQWVEVSPGDVSNFMTQ